MNFPILGIGGVAQSGKDSLYKALYFIDHRFIRYAFADKVREDLRPVILRQYGVDITNCSSSDKELCREIMVNYATLMREESKGMYWINAIETAIKSSIDSNLIPVITDVRFENEALWVQDMGGKVIHLQKWSYIDGLKTYHPPPNATEAANDPIVQRNANLCAEWPQGMPQTEMIKFAKLVLEKLKAS